MYKVLLVEDEKILRDAYTILLNAQSEYQLDVATNGQEALEFCQKSSYDLILLDLMMPVLDGVGFLRSARLGVTSPKTKVIVMSNLSTNEGLTEAIKLGVSRHEVKSSLSPADVLMIMKQELQT